MTNRIVELLFSLWKTILVKVFLHKLSDSSKICSSPCISLLGCLWASITFFFRVGFNIELVAPARL